MHLFCFRIRQCTTPQIRMRLIILLDRLQRQQSHYLQTTRLMWLILNEIWALWDSPLIDPNWYYQSSLCGRGRIQIYLTGVQPPYRLKRLDGGWSCMSVCQLGFERPRPHRPKWRRTVWNWMTHSSLSVKSWTRVNSIRMSCQSKSRTYGACLKRTMVMVVHHQSHYLNPSFSDT